MLDFQRSSFQSSVQGSSWVRISVGVDNTPEAEVPSALHAGAGRDTQELPAGGGGDAAGLDITEWKQEGLFPCMSDRLLDHPQCSQCGPLMPQGSDGAHGKATGEPGRCSVLRMFVTKKKNQTHGQVCTSLLKKRLRFLKKSPTLSQFHVLLSEVFKKSESNPLPLYPQWRRAEKWPLQSRGQTVPADRLHIWKPGCFFRTRADYFHLSRPSDND